LSACCGKSLGGFLAEYGARAKGHAGAFFPDERDYLAENQQGIF